VPAVTVSPAGQLTTACPSKVNANVRADTARNATRINGTHLGSPRGRVKRNEADDVEITATPLHDHSNRTSTMSSATNSKLTDDADARGGAVHLRSSNERQIDWVLVFAARGLHAVRMQGEKKSVFSQKAVGRQTSRGKAPSTEIQRAQEKEM
jgi:hypothetical protein